MALIVSMKKQVTSTSNINWLTEITLKLYNCFQPRSSSTMAIRPVRQSASKEAFLEAISLNLARSSDRQTFQTMWVS